MKFSVAGEFCSFPAGATKEDGPCSGEALREKLLLLLQNWGHIEVDLDGTMGYGSNFLEAAFTNLPEPHRITFVSTDTSLISEIGGYLARSSTPIKKKTNHLHEADACLHEVALLKPGGVGHAQGLHNALVEVIAHLAERDGIKDFKPTVLTQRGPTIKQLQDLWRVCAAWRDTHKPIAPESLHQVDRINAETPMLAEAVLGVVGYWKDAEDG